MRSVELRTEATVGLLLADLFVLWFAFCVVLEAEAPTWFRLASGAVAVLAAALAVRSLTLLLRARAAKQH